MLRDAADKIAGDPRVQGVVLAAKQVDGPRHPVNYRRAPAPRFNFCPTQLSAQLRFAPNCHWIPAYHCGPLKRTLTLVFSLAFTAGCGSGDGMGEKGGGKWGKKQGGPVEAVPVKTEKLGRGPIALRLLTTSTVDPVRRVEVVSKATGKVKELLVAEGEKVAAEDVLARLDDEELALAQKKAEVGEKKAKDDYEHMKTLLAEKYVSVDEFRKAEQTWQTAKLEVESANLALANATVRAPIAGTVTRLDVQKGKYVTANAAFGEITDLSELECVIYVPEKDVFRLREGQPADVASESLNAKFTATVKRINPVIDRTSGTAKAYLALSDPGNRLRPGMFVDVSIVLEPHDKALLVPKKALVFDEGRPGVFVRKGEEAKWSELELGFQEKDIAEVVKGATEGDEVIVVGQSGLKDGTKVKVMAE
ncbi:MAG: RND family efflux transporter MFP [Planctomycetota bacterium]|nr:MAG: RND family efflux transporter MFP [Planctomycetota bacterium]